jgi:oxepin-CoA hydrolase/3-oxo-5,6-dehydrosuberyl-CoA semialdehyde dehydrogenase
VSDIQQLKSYVEGQWVAGSGNAVALYNPTTEAVIAEAASDGIDFGAALQHARTKGQASLGALSFHERGQLLKAMSKKLYEFRDELLDLSTANAGTTRGDSKFDVDGGTGTLAYYAGVAKSMPEGNRWVEEGSEQLTHTPRYIGRHICTPIAGAAVHINAFNFPAWGMLEKVAVSFLAGVPVVAKPGTSTAMPAVRIVEILVDSGLLPEGSLSLVTGSARQLLSHVGFGDAVAFTGSHGVGSKIAASVAGKARVNLETDSLNAVILGPDAEAGSETFDLFVKEAAKEITQKTGQKCTATRRMFVPTDLVEAVSEALSERLGRTKVGDPANGDVRMGPVANKQQFDDVTAGIQALAKECEFVYGDGGRGELIGIEGDTGWFISPVVLRAPSWETPVVHGDEVFGPCATILPYSGDAGEAVQGVQLGQGGLVASCYSDDADWLDTVIHGMAPYSGRITVGSTKIAESAPGPGMVMPHMVHGGPGRAGGGEELGGLRGLHFYWQRTAVQGDKGLLGKILGK